MTSPSVDSLAPDAGLAMSTDTSFDVSDTIASVRAGIVRLSAATYGIAMLGIVTLVIGSSPSSLAAVASIVVTGAAVTLIAVTLLERLLSRVDRLGTQNTELSDLYDRARLDALRDPLTGLGNHRAFQEELDRAVAMARRHRQSTALLLIDVDDLKRINDSEGHAAGDEVLQDVARVIVSNLRRIDRAFRIGGDEFAVLSPQSTAEEGLSLGRRLLATALGATAPLGLQPTSFTVGVSAVPDPSPDRNLLYRHADAALYWAKRHGRTDVRVYDPALQGTADDDRPVEELARAVDRVVAEGRLTAMFQPVFALDSGACLGFEGLVRPAEGAGFRDASALFIAAEVVNRTVELDLAAIRAIASGATDLAPGQHLAVNLSPRTLEAAAFSPHEVIKIMSKAGITPDRLIVELTEREAIEDFDRLDANMQTLRRMGVRIAADDVGAGNAGLRMLSRLSFDVIKVDLSLVQSGAVLRPSRSVMLAIIDMAKRSEAQTVAEGIETPLQLETLRELGIAVGQGYLLGKPVRQPVVESIDIAALLAAAEAPQAYPGLALAG